VLSLEQANAGGQDYKMLWSQLQHGQKLPWSAAAKAAPVTGHDKPRPTIRPPGAPRPLIRPPGPPQPTIRPPDPRVNGHLLSLPPSWLKKDVGSASATAKSETKSVQNPSENPVTPQKPTQVSAWITCCTSSLITALIHSFDMISLEHSRC